MVHHSTVLAVGREDGGASAEEHLLQEVVDLRHAARLGDADLLDHLPRDGLEAGQRQQDLAEAAAAVVEPLRGDVILQVDLQWGHSRLLEVYEHCVIFCFIT